MDKEKEERTVLLPLKTVNTIISNASDGSVKCSKPFVKMQLCATAFVGQLAMELSVQADKDKCKTIGNEQVLHALEQLGFDQLAAEVKQRMKDPNFVTKRKQNAKKRMLEVSELPVAKEQKTD